MVFCFCMNREIRTEANPAIRVRLVECDGQVYLGDKAQMFGVVP